MSSPLHALTEHGASPWVDHLARGFVRDGDLGRLVERGIRGVTSNPTIFASAIAEGDAYDEQLRDVLRTESDPKEIFLVLAIDDVKAACDVLRPTFDGSDDRRDGWVSLEVDPRMASDADATMAEAIRLHALVDRPNLMVKIPGTAAGLEAVEETVARGVPVNVTLLFSLQRHRQAARAYLRGLNRLLRNGGDPRSAASVASFFVSRVDTEADRRLAEADGPAELAGTLAIANAKLAYHAYLEIFDGPEWTDLRREGAGPQRCLWASTSMKDPGRRDVTYVEELVGPDTVTTMPAATIDAFLDHGRISDTLIEGVGDARETLRRFEDVGVSYDAVVGALERDGVATFRDSFRQLLDGIAAKRDQLAPA